MLRAWRRVLAHSLTLSLWGGRAPGWHAGTRSRWSTRACKSSLSSSAARTTVRSFVPFARAWPLCPELNAAAPGRATRILAPFAGGKWKIHVELPDNYPFKSPSIGFVNRIFHPNIDEVYGLVAHCAARPTARANVARHGGGRALSHSQVRVCVLGRDQPNLDADVRYVFPPPLSSSARSHALSPRLGRACAPCADLINVLEVFLPQLLTYPNPADPLNGEAAAMLIRDPQGYQTRVKGKGPRTSPTRAPHVMSAPRTSCLRPAPSFSVPRMSCVCPARHVRAPHVMTAPCRAFCSRSSCPALVCALALARALPRRFLLKPCPAAFFQSPALPLSSQALAPFLPKSCPFLPKPCPRALTRVCCRSNRPCEALCDPGGPGVWRRAERRGGRAQSPGRL